ncbi:MAG: hypothetical protein ABI268_06715, partial [Rhodanobacter sp.]
MQVAKGYVQPSPIKSSATPAYPQVPCAIHIYYFFNGLIDGGLFQIVEQRLPVHRERFFPSTSDH